MMKQVLLYGKEEMEGILNQAILNLLDKYLIFMLNLLLK